MEENGEITLKEAKTITRKSTAAVRRYLKILVDTKFIIAKGNTNNIVYHISKKLSEYD